MRGSPLLRALLVFLAILALGYPLRRLTNGAEESQVAAPPGTGAPVREVELQLTFTTPPKSFAIRHLGKEIWSDRSGQTMVERKLMLPYPKEGVDLQFAADFPDDAPVAAVRLKLTDPDGDAHEKTCWGTGQIIEVVTLP